jgi:hypothetical protein
MLVDGCMAVFRGMYRNGKRNKKIRFLRYPLRDLIIPGILMQSIQNALRDFLPFKGAW